MPDVREVFRVATQNVRPAPGALERQLREQRRRARNRKMRALAVAAAITAAVALFASGVLNHGKDGSAPATIGPSAPEVSFTVMGLDGSVRSSIAALPEGASMPDVSPDGSQVAFTITARQGEDDGLGSQIAVMNLDGTGLHTVTNGRRLTDEWPRWSPDGTRLLFYRLLSYRSQATNGRGYGRLVWMNADGTNPQVIQGTRAPDEQPAAWSPDGSTILYTSLAGGSRHLESIRATGGRSQEVGGSRREEGGGAWSTDGEMIAFARQASHSVLTRGITVSLTSQIWLMNVDGSHQRRLVAVADVNVEAPEWSPDGSMIAFIGSKYGIGGGESDSDAVYVVNVATGEITQVLQGIAVGIGHESRATWLPDGVALLGMTKTP